MDNLTRGKRGTLWQLAGEARFTVVKLRSGYRVHQGGRRRGDKCKGFTEADYVRLLEGFLAGTRLDLTPLCNPLN